MAATGSGGRWMWAKPGMTLLGARSAQCNPWRWSRRMAAPDLALDLDHFRTHHRHRNRQVLLESAEGDRRVYESVDQAMAALKPRRAKASDWILVKKVEGTGQRWVYVPDMVKRIKASKLSNISEDAAATGSLMSDPLLQALDAESLELVFASMRGKSKSKKGSKRDRNFSSSTISTCSSASSMESSSSTSSVFLDSVASLPRPMSGGNVSAMGGNVSAIGQGRTRSAPATRDRRYMD